MPGRGSRLVAVVALGAEVDAGRGRDTIILQGVRLLIGGGGANRLLAVDFGGEFVKVRPLLFPPFRLAGWAAPQTLPLDSWRLDNRNLSF